MEHKEKFREQGVKMVAVGNGNAMFAKGFKEGLPFDGEVYLDEESKVFNSLELTRLTKWQAAKRWFMDFKVLSLFSSISKTYKSSNNSGDGLQTGGVFVVAPGDSIHYSFIENEHRADQFADIDEMLRVCASIKQEQARSEGKGEKGVEVKEEES